jgi:hypothetical protein
MELPDVSNLPVAKRGRVARREFGHIG